MKDIDSRRSRNLLFELPAKTFFRHWCLAPILTYAAGADARFHHFDAARVDEEERQEIESINDSLSYRFPHAWDDYFRESNAAFRISAGSLSAKRFEYIEEMHFYTDRSANYAMWFERHRIEDYVQDLDESEIAIETMISGPLRLAILGDSGSFKEFGDLGTKIVWRESKHREVALTAWSVDHYYNSKKSDVSDSRTGSKASFEVDGHWQWDGGSTLQLTAQRNPKLVWKRSSQNHVYSHAEDLFATEFRTPRSATESLGIRAQLQTKAESKIGLNDFTHQEKAMKRAHREVELDWRRRADQITTSVGYFGLQRRADYLQTNLSPDLNTGLAPTSPDRVLRTEHAIYLTQHAPTTLWGDFVQFGLFLNSARLETYEVLQDFEAKLQTAWDFRFQERGYAQLNITWDIDRLFDAYPYPDSERSFNPWGGGNLQFMFAF